MPIVLILVAAILEVLGDTLVRHGLRGANWWGLLAGAAVLFGYGLAVNWSQWDFGRLMGIYIAAFFLVAQLSAVIIFHERPKLPIYVGGILILTGGAVIALWQPK